MGLFDQFPYTNFHELNLMWILQALKEIETTTEQFVAINSLKYADPIQWNIVKQYEKNTIVIDPLTGTAYISVAAVPSGVALTNTDYWTVVFDLGSFVTKAAKNFTLRWEEATTLTATFNTAAGQWLVWGDTLYRAASNIIAGDSYVIDSNIIRITVEEIKDEIYSTFDGKIGELQDLETQDKNNLVAAINEVCNVIVDKIGMLADLDTEDKSNLVAAINEVVTGIGNINDNITDINDTIDQVKDSGLFYQNAVRHGMSLQTTWTREYNNLKAKSFAVYENTLVILFEDQTLEIFNITATPWTLQNSITLNNAIAIAIDSNYIYALENATIIKYNYSLAAIDSITITSGKYSRIRFWNDKLYLLKTTSSSIDIFDLDLNLLESKDYVGQHLNTMFAISTNFAVFGLMGNRSNHAYNNAHPERYEWVFTYPIFSNTQNPIPNTFDVCARSDTTFWILSNNISVHDNINLLTLSQFDFVFSWDGAQYDNANNPIVNLTQYITPEMKNTIQKISGARNTPYSEYSHAQDEIPLCSKLYSMLYASNNDNNFPELYLENIAIPIRVAIDSQSSGTPNFSGIYINNCNHVELVGIKCTGKVAENYTGSIFIRNSKVLLDNVTIIKDDAPQDIQAREGSTVYCFNCTPASGAMVINTRLSTVTQYPT